MTVTGKQIRDGRALVGMSEADLAKAAGVRIRDLQIAEQTDGLPLVSLADAAAIQDALEAAGVEFEFGHHGASVRLGVALKNQLKAIDLLKEWTTWLVAIETAAIAAIGAGVKDIAFDPAVCSASRQFGCAFLAKMLATGSVGSLGVSMLASIYLLLALPAAAQRLPPPLGRDIYFLRTGGWFAWRLYHYVRVVRWGSLCGFGLLLALVTLVVWTRKIG